jgi:hypothetical protein
MYIDSVEHISESVSELDGWIVSTQHTIEDILINGKSLSPKFTVRTDVTETYIEGGKKPGVKFRIDRRDVFKPLQIKFKGVSNIMEIESISKWLAYYSGFANEDKGLIVVDNFYNNPDFVREWAINKIDFKSSEYHKGERSTNRFSIYGMKEKLEEIIGKQIYNWNNSSYANGIFQFCTADQPIVYHVDNQTYAGIVFLSPNSPTNTGTSFYRSKSTGAYGFDAESRKTEKYVRAFKGTSAEMNFYDGTNFEKIDEVGSVYNRLVLFDAKNIHAATQYFGDTIDNARFFHMFFFDV